MQQHLHVVHVRSSAHDRAVQRLVCALLAQPQPAGADLRKVPRISLSRMHGRCMDAKDTTACYCY